MEELQPVQPPLDANAVDSLGMADAAENMGSARDLDQPAHVELRAGKGLESAWQFTEMITFAAMPVGQQRGIVKDGKVD